MRRVLFFLAPALGLLLNAIPAAAQSSGPLTPERLGGFAFRELGPAVMAGRVHDVEAVPGRSQVVYVGAASGGVWRSRNGGTTWTPLWDDLPNSSVGDIALAPSDPDILYVGTGGPNNRQSTLYGNGVWKSTDAGDTWTHLGLVETRHIGRIRVHPTDPDIAYVAALGNLWKADAERGVFKTTNGGRSWSKVLYVDEDTGAVDLVMDPADPEVLFAATYQRRRRTFGFDGGGPGSGIWKTTDGGRHWVELGGGIPEGDKGRIGLAIAASSQDILNATIETADRQSQGTYRTTDGGATWERVSGTNPRPMYYSHIYIDPNDPDRVYVLGTDSSVSDDGGRTFRGVPGTLTYDFGLHQDHHALWIDPDDSDHLYLAGDAGLNVSWDGGTNWTRINNMAIGQFYGIGADMQDPYNVYGGMQDNHSWMGPSRTRRVIGIINDDWRQIGFSDGQYTRPDPVEPRWVFLDATGGSISRFDTRTGSSQGIQPSPPAGEARYRFDWTAPILISPHDHHRIYLGGNRLFISEDHGDSWWSTADLTRNLDTSTMPVMGAPTGRGTISRDDGVSAFGAITTIDESVRVPGLLWVGTDDGNVQVSRDGGGSWTEVGHAVRGVPDGTYVSRVIASRFTDGRAYVTFDAHRDGDFRPYLFTTEDFGVTWKQISGGFPDDGSVNVIIEHPDTPDVLFAGTEHALFVTGDRGAHWFRFKNGLPTAPVDDLLIHPREKDLIVGTHGRSLWVLDDVGPLGMLASEVAAEPLHLFPMRPATQLQTWKATSYRAQGAYAAPQPPEAVITYWLAEPLETAPEIEVSDETGRVVSRLVGSAVAGFNRVVWNLRMDPPASNFRGGGRGGSSYPAMTPYLERVVAPTGPLVKPGTWTVTVRAGGQERHGSLEVRPDPDDPLTSAQREARWQFLSGAYDLQQKGYDEGLDLRDLVESARAVKTAIEGREGLPDSLEAEVDSVILRLDALQSGYWNRLRSSAGRLLRSYGTSASNRGTLAGPLPSEREQLAALEEEAASLASEYRAVRSGILPELDRRLEAAGLPTILGT